MSVPPVIFISAGNGKPKIKYYLWEVFNTLEEAKDIAKKMKLERKGELNLKYFILEVEEGRFLPVNSFALFYNKKLRLI